MTLLLTDRKRHQHQRYQVADVLENKADGLILMVSNEAMGEIELDMAIEEPVSGYYGNWSWIIN